MFKRFITTLLLLLGSVVPLYAADVPIFPTGPVYKLPPLTWGVSSATGFNNNFFFTPLQTTENVCVYIKNNNPTSAHPFATTIVVTPDPSNITPSDGTWIAATNFAGMAVGASPSISTGISANVAGVAQVSINFSGSGTLAGSPDTATIIISQSSGQCFSGNSVNIGGALAASANSPFGANSEALTQANFATQTITNPAINAVIQHINVGASNSQSLFFDKLIVSCSATCVININSTQSSGVGCGASAVVNAKLNQPSGNQPVSNAGCTTPPTLLNGIMTNMTLAAGTPFILDLRGFISPATQAGSVLPTGIEVQMAAALTGTATATIFWSQK